MLYRMLTCERTDYGKAIRKSYESGAVSSEWDRIRRMVPRKDELSNTITGAIKDYLIVCVDCEESELQTILDSFF